MKNYSYILLMAALTAGSCAATRTPGRYPASAAPLEKQYVVILSMDAFR